MLVEDGDEVLTHGTTCAYCLWRFTGETAEAVTVCQACGTTYHDDCFTENGGCATFGCPEWVTSQGVAGVPGVVVPPPAPDPVAASPLAVPAPDLDRLARTAPEEPVEVRPPGSQPWRFCWQCGAEIQPDYEFCCQCGLRIGAQA